MTKKYKIAIVLGITFFALISGIGIQIRTVKNTNQKVGKSYAENNLRAEVLKYKEKYDILINNLEKINKEIDEKVKLSSENNSDLKEKQEEILNANKEIGLEEVKGPGIKLIIADSNLDANTSTDPSRLLVHDADVLKIVNELKNAGAEAISINDQRLISTSYIYCGGNIININGERIGSPFTIKAIGMPETLANLDRPGGNLSLLKERKLKVSLTKENEITIPKYSGVLKFKYLKSIN